MGDRVGMLGPAARNCRGCDPGFASQPPRPMHEVRLRPPRHARPLSGMRRRPRGEGGKGMRRKLFTLAAAVSAAVCWAAVTVLWAVCVPVRPNYRPPLAIVG